MKLTIYLDQKTTIYYQQMANTLGVPLRTAVKTVLEDLVDKDEEQVNQVLEIVSSAFKDAFKGVLDMNKVAKGLQIERHGEER